MRQILFRGKRVGTDEWVEGDLVHDYWISDNKTLKTAIRYLIGSHYSFPIEVDPSTVGQFTGLTDKNGKEVFEGDLIHNDNWNPSIYKVIFDNGEFCFVSIHMIESPYTNSIHYVGDFETIGNTHDNPELL